MLIPRRFNGPPDSGNGGYSAGLLAARLTAGGAGSRADGAGGGGTDGGVEVTLRLPPPLDTELTVTAEDDGVAARDSDALVATARPVSVTELVPPVPYDEAVKASLDYSGFTAHPFPTCYSCGPERSDGLRLFPGRLPDGRVAAPFTVPDDVSCPTVWAALDCPGGWTIGIESRPYVLGRIAARVDRVPAPGSRCVVTGALLAQDGRKAHVATTLWPADGDEPCAAAHATWIALR